MLAERRRWRAGRVYARLAVWALLSGLTVAAVLWPFLAWSRGQGLQAAIEHASRDNVLTSAVAAWYFFWPMYGPLLLVVPALLWLAVRAPCWRPAAALAGVLVVLGLGGTTPLPRWLFGAGWAWLTYDRFALWAAVALLPVAGALALGAWRWRARWQT